MNSVLNNNMMCQWIDSFYYSIVKYFVQCCVLVRPPQLASPDLHMTYTMLCTILQYAVLFCDVLFCNAPYCTECSSSILYVTVLYYSASIHFVLHYTVLRRTILPLSLSMLNVGCPSARQLLILYQSL